MAITSKQRSQLRGLAASLDTVLQIGKGGITENVIASANDSLRAHR